MSFGENNIGFTKEMACGLALIKMEIQVDTGNTV